MSQMLNFD